MPGQTDEARTMQQILAPERRRKQPAVTSTGGTETAQNTEDTSRAGEGRTLQDDEGRSNRHSGSMASQNDNPVANEDISQKFGNVETSDTAVATTGIPTRALGKKLQQEFKDIITSGNARSSSGVYLDDEVEK